MAVNGRPRLPETFADRLSYLFEVSTRTPSGDLWTNTALADAVTALGVPTVQSYISQLRHGKRTNPSADLVGAIATAFEVAVGYFYGDERLAQAEIRTAEALRKVGVQSIAWRASQLSAEGLQTLTQMAEFIADQEGIQRDPLNP